MGMIRKKTGIRGSEGGLKFVCDYCSADITSTVRIQCVPCTDYLLCVTCFAKGNANREHDPVTHAYRVIEQHSIPIFDEEWGADEETLLLEGAETYGLGSWADIANHIGGVRYKDEARDHYIKTYIDSGRFPLPNHASPSDRALIDAISRDEFQSRKKRRIEERKQEAANAPATQPKKKPTASTPSCHEVQGFMPGRLEFETEYFNEAEEAVQHMSFEPGDGTKAVDEDPELELKMMIMGIYNHKLTQRVERKKIIFEHRLLEYKKNQALDKKRTKEERDLVNRAKPFARMMNHDDFVDLCKGLEYEHNLRIAITQLQEWRSFRVEDVKSGEKYEIEKAARASRVSQFAGLDRNLQRALGKAPPQPEGPSQASLLVSLDLPLRPYSANPLQTPPPSDTEIPPKPTGVKFAVQPLQNTTPLNFDSDPSSTEDLHLLTEEEKEVCRILRIFPKPYIVLKDTVLNEAVKHGGSMKKKAMRDLCKIDTTKASRLFDFWVHAGWIAKS